MPDKIETVDQARALFSEVVGVKFDELKKMQKDAEAKWAQDFSAHQMQFEAQRKHRDLPKGIRAARYCRAMIAGRKNIDEALRFSKGWNDDVLNKTLTESVFDAGGALVPQEYAAEIIELLREEAAVLSLNPQRTPMPGGNITFRKVTAGATGYWVGDSEVITKSEQTFGDVKLTTKTLGILVPVNNKLLAHTAATGVAADEIVLNDMIGAGGETLDLQLIRGNGTANKPTGLRYLCATSTNLLTATMAGATPTLAEIVYDLGRLVLAVMDKKIKVRRGGFIFATRVYMHLYTITNSLGLREFRDEMDKGMLFGFPFRFTSLIPVTGLTGTGQTEVTFADFSRILFGEDGPMKVDTFDGGAYSVGGTVYSGISQNETVMRVMLDTDLQARHGGQEIAVLQNCEWGK